MVEVGFVTYRAEVPFTRDDAHAARALEADGVRVHSVLAGEPIENLKEFQALIIRSPWDYWKDADAFYRWCCAAEKTGLPLLNPSRTILENIKKTYLRDLAKQGVRTPMTEFVDNLSEENLRRALQRFGPYVCKPSVSAGSFETHRISCERGIEALLPKLETLNALPSFGTRQDRFILQEFCPEILAAGEKSLIYFNGKFSHGVLKKNPKGDFRIQGQFGGTLAPFKPSPDERSACEKIASIMHAEDLLYARFDFVGDRLMEVELIEPCLYFEMDPASPQRFANAVKRKLKL